MRTQLTLYPLRGHATATVRVRVSSRRMFTLSHQQDQLARKRAGLSARNAWIGGVDRHGRKWLMLGVLERDRSGC